MMCKSTSYLFFISVSSNFTNESPMTTGSLVSTIIFFITPFIGEVTTVGLFADTSTGANADMLMGINKIRIEVIMKNHLNFPLKKLLILSNKFGPFLNAKSA